jgi:diguanylate cyclase (GGDEF)-like protein
MREDGTIRYVHSYGKIYGSAIDQSRYFAGVLHDITERRQSEEKLRRQAYSDELTNLPNRNYFMEQLAKTLAQSRRHDYFSALLFFDLDNFKIINDTLGHHTGDKLLADVGMRLRKVIRKEDTAARLGGDEFVIIVTNLGSEPQHAADQARLIAEKVHNALAMPFNMAGHEHHLTMSTGINLFPFDSEDINDILKFADTAMYRAKESGRNAICFFQPGMQQAAEERFALQGRMRQALSNDEFELFYQPQFNSNGEIIGAESLLRWQQPELGMVSPARFIPLAEESGMILDIGIWVLREACHQIIVWQQQGIDIETLAVNVSPRQFHQPDFVAQIEAIIRESGINPHRLELELTEGVLVENIYDVTQKMEQLQQMGIRFAIDDFGTGYSSLRYLKQLPLDRLKIDQSFVRDIHLTEANALIVETIISMAHHLELELIAEGVETLEELKFLKLRGCHKFQGYYFSRPLPAPQLTAKLLGLKQPTMEVAP